MKKYLILIILLYPSLIMAQRFSISTNLIGYANFGTLNLEASYAVAQNWSINASAKYNPFTFKEGDPKVQFQNRQKTFSIGTRYWPWHVYSDWWIGGRFQHQEYNTGGILFRRTEEGDRYGIGISAGYTLLVNKKFNIDFGLGCWGGLKEYTTYSCPLCGIVEKEDVSLFIMPNDILISLVYVF